MSFSLLAYVTGSPALQRFGRWYKSLWKRLFFWPLNVLRKSRFQLLGLSRKTPLAVAELDLVEKCSCRPSQYLLGHTHREVDGFCRRKGPSPRAGLFSPTAAVLDLDPFPDFEAWRVQVSRATSGKYHRSANKARRLGYVTRFVGHDAYKRSVYELTGSKLRRSKGLIVWAALTGPRPDLADTKARAVPPVCAHHWRQCWAIFRPLPDGEQLVAHAIVIRAGNIAWVQRFIGHGEALRDGVTKMLIFDIMQWLLGRDIAATQGIRYLVHGSIEEGGAGLFDWKRYLGFKPMLIGVCNTAAS